MCSTYRELPDDSNLEDTMAGVLKTEIGKTSGSMFGSYTVDADSVTTATVKKETDSGAEGIKIAASLFVALLVSCINALA